jgi:stage IV sporulation protein FB
MSDPSNWGLHLGRWFRVQVRIHAIFVAVAIFALFLSTAHQEDAAAYGLLSVAVLFLSVLAHDLGHCAAAVRLGGSADRITVGPLGGFSYPELPRESQPELITALAGPIVNLGLLLLALPMLTAAGVSVLGLLNPVAPVQLFEGEWWHVALKLVFWFNWLLLAVNLLPALPFDGARMLRAVLWPALDHRLAGVVTVRVSKLVALGFCLLAWVLREPQPSEVLPAWVPLLLVAVMIYFCAQQEGARLEATDWDEDLLSYDFSQGYTSLERGSDGPRRPGMSVRRWFENRRELRRRRRQWQEQEEERQVDEILIRLHETGIRSLSSKERALLDRVSARFRNRQRSN